MRFEIILILKLFSAVPTSGAASPSELSVCLLGVTVTNGAEEYSTRKSVLDRQMGMKTDIIQSNTYR